MNHLDVYGREMIKLIKVMSQMISQASLLLLREAFTWILNWNLFLAVWEKYLAVKSFDQFTPSITLSEQGEVAFVTRNRILISIAV